MSNLHRPSSTPHNVRYVNLKRAMGGELAHTWPPYSA